MSIGGFFFFQAEDGIRDVAVTGVQTCALPISLVRCPAPHRGTVGARYFLAAQGFLAPAIFLPGLTATRSATALPSWSIYLTLTQSPDWMSAAVIALPDFLIIVLSSRANVHSPS